MMLEAMVTWPERVDLNRRLAAAYSILGREKEALTALEPYLDRHPEDLRALFLALGLVYSAHVEGRAIADLDQDRARFDAYAARYAAANGPNQSLVTEWRRFLAHKKNPVEARDSEPAGGWPVDCRLGTAPAAASGSHQRDQLPSGRESCSLTSPVA
jgi:hypothetical protein